MEGDTGVVECDTNGRRRVYHGNLGAVPWKEEYDAEEGVESNMELEGDGCQGEGDTAGGKVQEVGG